MPMNRNDFLNCLIDDGIYEIQISYLRPDQKDKREGGIAGFEACRGKSDVQIQALLKQAKEDTIHCREIESDNYWWFVMFERQVEWVLNVLSGALYLNNQDVLIPTTARGVSKALDILGARV